MSSDFYLFSHSQEYTINIGKKIACQIDKCTFIGLEGNLGSGKTILTKGIALGLGITETVVSPTFQILREYSEGKLPLYHFDFYRLDSYDDLKLLEIDSYIESGVVVCEWSEKFPQLNYESFIKLRITYENEVTRKIYLMDCTENFKSLRQIFIYNHQKLLSL